MLLSPEGAGFENLCEIRQFGARCSPSDLCIFRLIFISKIKQTKPKGNKFVFKPVSVSARCGRLYYT
jgi:hypothetical protein